MGWGIAETASEIEKIKSESADYLNGLNSCGVIDWNTYNYAFEFYADLLMKAYKQGEKDAQSEPCDDPRADVYYLAEKIGIHRLYALVVEFRGEPEPCEDAVSRADVIKEISESVCDLEYNCDNRALCEVIKALPSVTPKRKTGKWIDISNKWGRKFECDQCGYIVDLEDGGIYDFCGACGADMRGEQE